MRRLSIPAREFQDIAVEEFRNRYFDVGQPVLLRSFLRSWAASKVWTPAEFADRFGAETIEVMRTALCHDPHAVGPYKGAHTMTMAEFARLCASDAADLNSDLYLVAQSQLLRRASFAALAADMTFDPAWFDACQWLTHVSLWMGPGGTVTPLHFDLQNAFLTQAYGRKRVLLIAPHETPRLYKGTTGYSAVNPEQPDLNTHPLFEEVTVFDATLERGDALFLPYGWWHHVRSLTASISLSLSNFAWPG